LVIADRILGEVETPPDPRMTSEPTTLDYAGRESQPLPTISYASFFGLCLAIVLPLVLVYVWARFETRGMPFSQRMHFVFVPGYIGTFWLLLVGAFVVAQVTRRKCRCRARRPSAGSSSRG
jgi:hypothetical protein